MSAYVITEVEVLDEALIARYRELATPSTAHYGGVYLAKGVHPVVVEGDFPPARRVVIVEFPSLERAREWYSSPEYTQARETCASGYDRRMLFVEIEASAP
jgi:uncharacterized protein (DUF1330 family)